MPGSINPYKGLADAIRAYLALHPDAADSDQGVAGWWLPEVRVSATVEEVRSALEFLCERGDMQSQTLMDGRVIYRAARTRRTGGTKN